MKQFKKLLPFAMATSSIALVAPIITSCSNAVLTISDFEYNPEQHKEDQVNVTFQDLKPYQEIEKEYCANNLQHFLEDYAYEVAQQEKATKLAIEAEPKNSNVKCSFNLIFSNVSFKESKQKVSQSHPEVEVPGYIVNFTATLANDIYYEHTEWTDANETKEITINHIQNKNVYTVNNHFLCLNPTEDSPTTTFNTLLTYKNLNLGEEKWSTKLDDYIYSTVTETKQINDEIISSVTKVTSNSTSTYASEGKGIGMEVDNKSHYLEKVVVKLV